MRARVVRFSQRRSEEHTSELQSPYELVCRLLLEKKKPKLTDSHVFYNGQSPASSVEIMRLNFAYVSLFGGTTPFDATSRFEIDVENGSGLGGMNLTTIDPQGKPYYGYIVNGVFFFKSYGDHRNLHSFPTRRSSD